MPGPGKTCNPGDEGPGVSAAQGFRCWVRRNTWSAKPTTQSNCPQPLVQSNVNPVPCARVRGVLTPPNGSWTKTLLPVFSTWKSGNETQPPSPWGGPFTGPRRTFHCAPLVFQGSASHPNRMFPMWTLKRSNTGAPVS